MNKKENESVQFWLDEIEENMGAEDFQRYLFESIQSQYIERGRLSEKQIEVIKRIYERVTS